MMNKKIWTVFSPDGTRLCDVEKLEYNGSWMEHCRILCTVKSPQPIDFKIGSYILYRGERFELNYTPQVRKTSSRNSVGDAFIYDNIRFDWLADELVRCMFLDFVRYDNKVHYSPLSKYSFFADSLAKLAERIQVNLDRLYKGDKKWTISIQKEYVNTKDANIIVDNFTVWKALELAHSVFGANIIIRGRNIELGTAGLAANKVFKYGKGKGLYELVKTAEPDQSVITRLRAYGSTKNMPYRYYFSKSGADISNCLPNSMANANLMLPGFPEDSLDVYLDSPNTKTIGIREASVFFDGTNGMEEIYPTIENMRADDLAAAGVSVSVDEGDNGFLDQIADAEQITDDGIPPKDEKSEPKKKISFTITLKDIGFDIKKHLSADKATISMKSGMCGGREFEITECSRKGNKYVLTCNRVLDDGIQRYFPYSDYNIKAGDKFVLLNIQMPDVYIKAASQRLLKAAKEYLGKNDYVRYSYEPKVDEIELARQHDEAVKRGDKSIYMSIKEGDLMLFEDEDLGIKGGSIIIDKLNIKEGEGLIPTYEVTLRNEKSVGSLDRVQNKIDSIVTSLSSGSFGGYSAEQIRSIIYAYGSELFIRQYNGDVKDLITFLKGIKGGNWSINDSIAKFAKLLAESITTNELSSDTIKSKGFKPKSEGFIIKTDENGKSCLEVDNALIRRKATFVELVIASLRHVGGQITLSPASMQCIKVEERDNAYRCYFRNTDGERCVYNEFVVGDLARAQKFGAEKVGVHKNISTHYFWRAVVGVGDDYIDLSKTDCDQGSDAPQVGDDICQFGNKTDTDRQSVILLSAYGEYAGIYQFGGVNDYSLKGKEQTAISPAGNRFTGDFIVKGKNVTEIIDKSKTDAINQSNGYTEGIKNELAGKIGEVKGKIDGLKVGGRNLITKKGVWSDNSKLVLDNKDYPINLKASGSANHNSHPCIRLRSNSSFVPSKGDTITFSCYARTNKPYSEVIMLNRGAWKVHSKSQYSVSNEWKYITAKLQLTEDIVDNVNFEIVIYLPTGRYDDDSERFLEIKYPKAEIGNTATAWSPAPEDLELEIEQAKNEAISQAQSKFNQAVEQAKDLSTSAKADAIAEAQRGYIAAIKKSKQETTSAIDSVRDAVLLDAKDKYDKAVAEAQKLSGEAKDQAMADAKAKYDKAIKEANAYADRAKQQAIEEAKANTDREIKIVNNKFEATKEAFTSQYNEVKANLNDVSVKQTQIRQDVDNISLRADRAEEKVSGIDKRLSQAELKITPDAITSVVKSRVKVGGRNLLKGTSDSWIEDTFYENTAYHTYGFDFILEKDKWYVFSVEVEKLSSDNNSVSYSIGGGEKAGNYDVDFLKNWVEPIKKIGRQILYFSPNAVDGRWGEGKRKYFAFRFLNNWKPMKLRYRCVKLEEGNIPTDWSPAPEDTEASITELSTRIEQTDRSISLRVNQGKEEVKQEVLSSFNMDADGISLLGKKLNFVGLATFSAVNQAKAEAISEANKAANNAKSAAITEAQRRANEAKDTAIKDAQAKYEKATREAERLSGEAKDAAIKDAESKLEQAKADAQKKADAARDAAITEAKKAADKAMNDAVEAAQLKADAAKKAAIADAEEKYNEAVKKAQSLSDDAKAKAIADAEAKFNQAKLDAQAKADKAKADAIADADAKFKLTEQKIIDSKDAAISEAQNKVDAAKKELGTQITEAQNKALNDAQTKFNEAVKQAEQLSGQAKDDAIIAAKSELDKEIKAANGYADGVVKALAGKLGSLAYSDKVGKAVLDETIIAGGFIKTSLINVQELAANEAFINNLTAKRLLVKDKEGFDVVNLDGQTKTAMIAGMEVRNNHLYARKAQYGISNSITVGPLNFSLKRRDSNLVQTFSVNGGGLTSSNSDSPTTYVSVSPVVPRVNVPLIGHYIDVRDSTFNSIAGCEQNYALYIPRGIICGLRYRTRVVTSNYTLTPMDTYILIDRDGVNLYLPNTAEDGQLYIVRNTRGSRYTAHGRILKTGSDVVLSDYTGKIWEIRYVYIKAKNYWVMSVADTE